MNFALKFAFLFLLHAVVPGAFSRLDGDGGTGPVRGQEQRGRPPLHPAAVLLQEGHPRLRRGVGRGQCDHKDTCGKHRLLLFFPPSVFGFSTSEEAKVLSHQEVVKQSVPSDGSFIFDVTPPGQGDALGAAGSHVDPGGPRRSQPAPLSANQQHPCVGGGPRPRQVGRP